MLLSNFLAIVFADNASDISASLVEGRHSVELLDTLRPRVIGGKSLDEIEVVALQEFAQIAASACDVRLRVEGILHAQLASGSRHQLHQSAGAFGGNGPSVESALGVNDAVHKIRIEPIGGAGRGHHFG